MRHTAIRNKAKQDWNIGQKVSIGFMRNLEVVEKVPTPNDGFPDAYKLRAANGTLYEFVPHSGLHRIS